MSASKTKKKLHSAKDQHTCKNILRTSGYHISIGNTAHNIYKCTTQVPTYKNIYKNYAFLNFHTFLLIPTVVTRNCSAHSFFSIFVPPPNTSKCPSNIKPVYFTLCTTNSTIKTFICSLSIIMQWTCESHQQHNILVLRVSLNWDKWHLHIFTAKFLSETHRLKCLQPKHSKTIF